MLKKYASWILGVSLALVLWAPIAHAKHWILLGTAHVDKNEDHKTIHVGNGAGEFRKIQLRVNGGAIDLQRLVVHFGNGTQEELAVAADRVRSGGKTPELDLPGERRTIESVELWYSKEYADTRPEVSLYGTR
jgi:hypothetical protein